MKKYKRNKRILITLSIICLLSSIFFFSLGFVKKTKTVNNEETSNIDYRVFLKPNDFFETSYLTKGQTYISHLIDYIDINYTYTNTYSEKLKGNYTYYFKGIVKAKKSNSDKGYYFSKEYKLSDDKIMTINNKDTIIVNDTISIDYQKYNDLLTAFKNKYGLSIDGELDVQLVINNDYDINNFTKHEKSTKTLNLTIPLTQLSVDIEFDSNEAVGNRKGTYSEVQDAKGIVYIIYKVIGSTFLFLTVVDVVLLIMVIRNRNKRTSEYQKTLTKIQATYDGIIVNINRPPDLKKYNVIKVSEFSELLDAHSEVRMPINFYEIEKNEKCLFILINNDIAWIYYLVNDR